MGIFKMLKKLNFYKILAVFLPLSWFVFILSLNEDGEWYFRFPVSIFIGITVPLIWRIDSIKKEYKEMGIMQEKLKNYCNNERFYNDN